MLAIVPATPSPAAFAPPGFAPPLVDWLAPMLLGAGVMLLLALLVIAATGRRRRVRVLETRLDAAVLQVDESRREVHDMSHRLGELLTIAQQAVDRLEQQAAQLAHLAIPAGQVGPTAFGHVHSDQPPNMVPAAATLEAKPPPQSGDGQARQQRASAGPVQSADVLWNKVCALADQGLGPVQIAQQLHDQIGRVELILALRQCAKSD